MRLNSTCSISLKVNLRFVPVEVGGAHCFDAKIMNDLKP